MAKKLNAVMKRRRMEGEVCTAVKSIRNHCLECCGYQQSEVERCTAPNCWLFPYRFGRNPEGYRRAGKKGIVVPARQKRTVRAK
jgi:hypothetical protein